MEIKLLIPGYKKDEKFYQAFQEGKLWESEYISDQSVWIPDEIPDFPIYFPSKKGEDHSEEFLKAIETIDTNILNMDRDNYMDELFWHSVLCLYKRDYLISLYPSITDSYKKFSDIVIKPFNWENYIYKAILIAQYVADERPSEKMKYYKIIFENMDMFNYIIKYEIFRNGTFLLNVMDIITDNHLEAKLKAKIKNRPDLGSDERYGRRVILELNRSYPVIMSPMLPEKELEKYFLKFLSNYMDEETETTEEAISYMGPDVDDKGFMLEEKSAEVKEVSVKNKIHSSYEQWLKNNGFLQRVVDQYIDKIEEISDWYKKEYSADFYAIKDIEELKKIENDLRERKNTLKCRTSIKYYIQFINENSSY